MTLANISIVTCSSKEDRYNSLKQNIKAIFGTGVQLIRANHPSSIAEGYNRCTSAATGDIIIFCHDDIEFLNHEAPSIIAEDLEKYDIVGVAGTSRLAEGRWHTGGQGCVHGHVAHSLKNQSDAYQICLYGEQSKPAIVRHIQALDGLFFAVRKPVLEDIRFDETFDGFHLYDLDFTYKAYLKGFRLAIDHRIHLLHHSGGKYDGIWDTYYHQFNRKYANIFAKKSMGNPQNIKRFLVNSKERLNTAMRDNYKGIVG